MLNNPIRYTDPTGHVACGDGEEHDCNGNKQDPNQNPHPYEPTNPTKDKDEDNEQPIPNSPSPSITPSITTDPLDHYSPGVSPNPSVGSLVGIGLLLTSAIVVSEIGLVWAEINFAPLVAANPLVGVPLELVLVSTSVALIDLDISYWSYTYRVQQNPDVKQDFEVIPPWGLKVD